MRHYLSILLFALALSLQGQNTYYVAPTGGSDSNAGTNINAPWATWQHAFETAQAGDTVYFREGVWYPSSPSNGNNINLISPRSGVGNNGEPNNRIHYFNYPGETPILDCRNVVAPGTYPNNRYLVGLAMYDAHWIHFKGLTIRNVYQREENVAARGVLGWPMSNMIFENVTIHNTGAEGIYSEIDVGYVEDPETEEQWVYGWDEVLGYVEYDTTNFINCDVYQCTDTLPSNEGNDSGNMGDGFKVINGGGYLTFENCRAWQCSDDGFDMPGGGISRFINCWSFSNGYSNGSPDDEYEGNGFKFGAHTASYSDPRKILVNCLAAYNKSNGFFVLEYAGYTETRARIYNCTSYANGTGLTLSYNPDYTNSGSIFRNMIIYGSLISDAGGRDYNIDAQSVYTVSNSTFYYTLYGSLARWDWDTNYPVSDADFVETSYAECISQMTASRGVDFSLPDITFMQLTESSPLREAGTQVPAGDNSGITLTFDGTAPDIGYMQSGGTAPSEGSSGAVFRSGNSLIIHNSKIVK